ncbi:MAG: prepilin-type N-terminal cleavage/methylation domain-containing protein [Patescibacteria group bacterium]
MSSRFSHLFKKINGFGLIELMVSISIMMLVAAVILARQSAFNGAVLLQSQAYEIALTAREVQTNAVSASVLAGTARQMLGLYFDTSRNTTYRIFRDVQGNGSYDVSEEYGQQNSLDSRFEIKAIRVGGTAQNSVSVMFERPDFDAKFYVGTSQVSAGLVEIDIGTKDNSAVGVKTIMITATGQVTVQ